MAGNWLFKSDPESYSFAQLQSEKHTTWDGVKNPLALKNLSRVKKGDRILIYHTGDEKAVIGTAHAASEPYVDPKKKDPKLVVVDIEAGRALRSPVALATIKASPKLRDFDLVRLPRLSVMPVSDDQWNEIERMSEKEV
jgi:predicted RNA-binding protein with PUA-like domain